MIPASYLFKDIYRRHWEEAPDPIVTAKNHRFIAGLMSPLLGAVVALFQPRLQPGTRIFVEHAHD